MLQSCAGLASAPCLAVTGAQLLDHPEACIRLSIVPGYVSKVKWGTRCWGTVLAWHAPCACLACTQCSTGAGIKLLECLSFAQPPPAVCSHPTQERHQVPAAQLSTCVAQVHRRHSLPQVGCSTLYPLPFYVSPVLCCRNFSTTQNQNSLAGCAAQRLPSWWQPTRMRMCPGRA